MKKDTISFKSDYFQIFILIIFSIIVGISYPYLQYGIDGGLVLSGIVKYPDLNSPMMYYFLNSWTSIHQFSSFLLQIGLSVEITSKIFMVMATIFFSFGVFLFCFSLTKQKHLSLFIALTSIILGKNFGDTDYPSLIFSEHTYGMLSLATFTFILGLIANKNIFFSCILILILISIHPVVGVWTLLIVSFIFYFLKIYNDYRNDIYKGIIIGIFFVVTSFLIFYFNTIEKVPFDKDLFLIYLDNWDGHRNISTEIHYEYIIKTILLASLCFFILMKKFKSSSYSPHLFIIFLSLICSLIIYFLYKLIPYIFPDFLKIIMPSRFIMLHTFLGWPIIISIIVYLTNNHFKNKIVFLVSLLLSLVIVQNYNKVILIKDGFLINFKSMEESAVINYIKKENIKTYLIVPSSLISHVFKKAETPILLHTESLDFIPYHPYLSNKFFYILEEIYNIKNNTPPEKNNPYLSDDYIRDVFENRSKEEWLSIKNKFNVEFIIVPNVWRLKLDINQEDERFKLYQL